MPTVGPRALVNAVLDAIQESGYSAVFLTKVREHPREFLVTSQDGQNTHVWVYIWTLTPGGRPNLPNEYRIQLTTVQSPLTLNPNGPTVLMGYEPDLNMFAGFDLQRHREFTPGSASVQIDIRTVREALQAGFAFDRKSNDEIAIGIRPDQFVNYVANSRDLHRYGVQGATLGLLSRAVALEEIPDDDIAALSEQRQRIVQTVSRLSRRGSFRQQVKFAYVLPLLEPEFSCARVSIAQGEPDVPETTQAV
jgi:putative restriction endonuclease